MSLPLCLKSLNKYEKEGRIYFIGHYAPNVFYLTIGLMAHKINIKHKESGMVKTGFYGFSWTYLLFGWFVPLFRGELVVGALHLLFTIVTLGLWQFIVCFLYNKQYMTRMLTSGWVLDGSDSDKVLAGTALGVSTPSSNE